MDGPTTETRQMPYKVYGASVSPFVRKVLVYLAEKGLDYEHDPVNPFSPPENYKAISPLGKIPAFQDGDKTLADSSVICQYLERRHPKPALYPGDDYDYARALWFEEFMDGAFVPKAGTGVFFPLVVAPMMRSEPVTYEVRASVAKCLDEEVSPLWDYLEGELGNREFFVGTKLTVADITVASMHVNLFHAGVDVDAGRWPHLADFVARMHARPSFKAIIDEEMPVWNRRDAA
jgi:glutathione S-transferase